MVSAAAHEVGTCIWMSMNADTYAQRCATNKYHQLWAIIWHTVACWTNITTPKRLMDQKAAHSQTNSQSSFYCLLFLTSSVYSIHPYTMCAFCDMYFGCWCRPISAHPNWSYVIPSTARQCNVPARPNLGTLKIPLSIRRLQPCGRKCAATGWVRLPFVMNSRAW